MPTAGLGCGRWGHTSQHGGLQSSPGRRLNKGLEGIGLLGVLGQVFQEQGVQAVGCVGCMRGAWTESGEVSQTGMLWQRVP